MRSTRLTRLATAAALLVAAGACSDSTGPSSNTPADLTAALSEMDLSRYVPADVDLGAPVAALATVPTGCAYAAASQSFTCPTMSQGGITATRSFQLLDAAGTPQSAFSATTTSAIRTTTDVKGTLTQSGQSLTIDHHGVMTLSGLHADTHVLDGTQQSHMTGSFSGFDFDGTVTTTIAGLRLPAANGASRYPLGGTITTASTDNAFTGSPSTSTMTMTFNGTSKVAVTFSSAGFTEHCTLDLAVNGPGAMTCS